MSTAGASEHPMPSPIPMPPTFPVTWEQPDDERLFWRHDRMHWPESITPMDGWSLHLALEDGYAAAAQAYELPIRRCARRINTYLYVAIAPLMTSLEDRVSPPEADDPARPGAARRAHHRGATVTNVRGRASSVCPWS